MSEFQPWISPLNRLTQEPLTQGGWIEYEDFSTAIDVTGPLLYTLFQERWQEVQIGHVVEGSVLELEFTAAPKICVIYDGYLTVVTEAWHLHLCLEDHRGGPLQKTPPELRQQRRVSRASLYRRFNAEGQPRSWGVQFWNGAGEKMMTLFLPNPFVGEDEELLPEGKPRLEKLGLYEDLRQIYILGQRPIPHSSNPLKHPYLAVCRSGRCLPSRKWQPIHAALSAAVQEAEMDVEVRAVGCLEVCQLGPVVFSSQDHTWYTRVSPEVARRIVFEDLGQGRKVLDHLYPSQDT